MGNVKTIIIFIALMFMGGVFAQQPNNKIDSLILSLETAPDTIKLKTYSKIIEAYANISYVKCIEFSKKRLELAIKLNNKEEELNSLTEMGLYTFYLGNAAKAIELFKASIAIAQKIESEKQLAKLHSNIGAMQEVLGRYDSAITYYQISLEMFEKQNDKSGIAFVRNNIGIVSEELGKHNNALKNYNISLAIKLELNDERGAASTYNNMGVVYENLADYDHALQYYDKALEIYTRLKLKKGIGTLLNNIGHIYKLQKQYGKAIEKYTKSLAIRKEIGDAEGMASTTSYLGILYLKVENLAMAENFLLESYDLARGQNSAKFLIQNSEQLAQLYSKKGKFEQAFHWHVKFASLLDSLQGIEQKNKITEIETKYETEKKIQQIASLEIENELKDAKIDRIYLFICVLLVFLGFGSIGVWLYFRNKRLVNEKNSIVMEQKLLRSQMNPHFIFNSLSVIQSFIYDNNSKSAVKYLSGFAKLIRLILENSRQEFISLDNEIQTLENYLELQKMRYDHKFDYQVNVAENTETSLYKVPPMLIQPFVENSIKHGILNREGKGLLVLSFKANTKLIEVEVLDNGIGRQKSMEINSKNPDKESSLATQITQERLANINRYRKQKIEFNIFDLKDEHNNASGTKVKIAIPI